MIDGAVGTTAALGEDGWKIHKEVANILGLPAATITNQVDSKRQPCGIYFNIS